MTRRLRPIATTSVEIDDSFWSPRVETNRTVTLRHQYAMLERTGRLENFRNAARGEGEFQGRYYNDSDVYKWLEAACHALATVDDPDLRETVREVAELVEAAQEDDGYLNTYFTLAVPREKRWTNSMMHELYCAGHFFEAAVAHRHATGEERLLDVARRLADHVDEVFGPDGKKGVPGHEEIELALVKLYRLTDEERYLDLARFFIDRRGREDSSMRRELEDIRSIAGALYNPDGVDTREIYRSHMLDEDGEYDGRYAQDHRPVREQEAVVGHAVRATYLYAGMADVAAETGDESLRRAVERLWRNMTTKRMYVTGGIGSTYENEGFTDDYDLPNETAYAETCAAIGNAFWNHRMLQLTGHGRYADLVERVLYNGFLSGVSLDGEGFRYTNPLESDGERHPLRDIDPGRYDQERFAFAHQGWFETACCPSNVVRLLSSLHTYVYMRGEDALAVNLYVGGRGTTTIDGTEVTVSQETDYPWEGRVDLELHADEPTPFELALRVPGWCEDATIEVNGERVGAEETDGYARVERTWADGDEVALELEMPVRQVEAHPDVPQTATKVALRRGPLVYCVEETDNATALHKLRVPADASFDAEFDPDALDGMTVLEGSVPVPDASTWGDDLYRTRRETPDRSVRATAVPYYAWGQRDVGAMRVWLHAA
jgi:hypothetical protein